MEWWFIKNIKIESNRIVEDGEECYNLLKEGRENTLPVKNRKCIITANFKTSRRMDILYQALWRSEISEQRPPGNGIF